MDFSGLCQRIREKVFQLSSKETKINGQAAVISGRLGAFSRAISANAECIAHKPKSLSYTEVEALPIGAMRGYELCHQEVGSH